jgi:hypothetical protein
VDHERGRSTVDQPPAAARGLTQVARGTVPGHGSST